MKYLILLVVLIGLIGWWVERRRAIVRDRLRERGSPRLGATPLIRCRLCGAYAVKGGGRCDRRDCPRG